MGRRKQIPGDPLVRGEEPTASPRVWTRVSTSESVRGVATRLGTVREFRRQEAGSRLLKKKMKCYVRKFLVNSKSTRDPK